MNQFQLRAVKLSKKLSKKSGLVILGLFVLGILPPLHQAKALELDWTGNFRSELNFIHNYTLDTNGAIQDPARAGQGGYYISGAGSDDANFETLFLKLKPRLVVNDNIYIKSEWWLGSPTSSLFGGAGPYSSDERYYYSNQSRGSTVTAQRVWAEMITDIGTFQVGRMPLQWGLGLVWNAGDGLWDHYESTGDAIRLIAKFGAFTFSPSFITYSIGNSVGGACNAGGSPLACMPGTGGSGGTADYSVSFKYENPDEDFEGGVNFIRRVEGNNPDQSYGLVSPLGFPNGQTFYNTWSIFARKKLGKLTLQGEAPLTSGTVGGLAYSTFAFAGEANYKASDNFEAGLKVGRAPGQPDSTSNTLGSYSAFYFNPNYRLGLIMFNYQFANFAGPNTNNNPAFGQSQASLYDNPIANANYLDFTAAVKTDKWNFHGSFIYAVADQSAAAGQYTYNTLNRKLTSTPAPENQSKSLGFETDVGAGFQWDEAFNFGLDVGLWFPGGYWAFSNATAAGSGAPLENATGMAFATEAKVAISF